MTYHSRVYAGGKVAIPADVRRQLGIKDGDRIVFDIEDGRLTITTRDQALRKLQDHVASILPPDFSLVDSLIADRRREAAEEEAKALRGV